MTAWTKEKPTVPGRYLRTCDLGMILTKVFADYVGPFGNTNLCTYDVMGNVILLDTVPDTTWWFGPIPEVPKET